jgi:hypothetical protein
MLSSDNNIRYLIGYYQAAIIAQHASRATARALALDLFLATLYGCVASLVMWWLMKLWPSLLWFTMLMALLSFFFAARVFDNGLRGLTPNFLRWSYGVTTVVFVIFPDALTQGFTGDDPNMKFYQRILDYALITAYSVFGVLLFDAIVDRLSVWRKRFARSAL